jgi:hypothetical protein
MRRLRTTPGRVIFLRGYGLDIRCHAAVFVRDCQPVNRVLLIGI